MKSFKNWQISSKLYCTFLLILTLTSILGVFAIVKIYQQNDVVKDLAENQITGIRTAGELDALVGSYRRGELLLSLSQDAAAKDKYIKRLSVDLEKIKGQQAAYEKFIDTEAERKTYEAYSKAWTSYSQLTAKVAELALQNNIVEVDKLIRGDSSKYFNAAIVALKANQDAQLKIAQESSKEIFKKNVSSCIWIAAAIFLCTLLGLILSALASRAISMPLVTLLKQVSRVSEGDLTARIEHASDDEVGQLGDAFNSMVINLRDIISKVIDTATQVSASALQLRNEAEQMAADSEEVVSKAGTMATASEEMAATSGDIAHNCTLAAHNSQQANDAAQTGVAVIKITVDEMNRISQQVQNTAKTVDGLGTRSDQIGTIIGTIEDIADQTNLLALNAAIEAARAGDQGRGFAVVADEVRALAERTTTATREIGSMIKAIQQETKSAVLAMENGVKEVAKGTADAARSGKALQDILDTISAVSLQVNQIAVAAEQQTSTTNQISHNIIQINDAVHDSARGAKETTDAAIKLSTVAEELQATVKKFRI